MKRITAILLLCIFCFNLMGFFFIFKFQQFRIAQETKYYIKRDIPREQLVSITVTPENEMELDWKHRKEFRYKGVVYNVVKRETVSEGMTILYCLADELATTLFSELDELLEKNKNTKNNESELLKNLYELFFSSIYALPQKLIWKFFPTGSAVSYSYLHHYASPVFDIPGPPPKLA